MMTDTQRQDNRIAMPNLQAWRRHRMMTHLQLCEKAQVSRDTLFRLERPGARANEMTAYKLAQALGVTVRQLQEELPPEKDIA